ncbi:MAG: hypothetical protein EOM37_04675 [Proteobacteria bacterium]|nr:hypothetical protein [Pseudomonadota bacterium]
MPDLVIGTKGIGHDTSVALVDQSGNVLYALTGERFSNVKHDNTFPFACFDTIKEIIEKENLGSVRFAVLSNDPLHNIKARLFTLIKDVLPSDMASLIENSILSALPDLLTAQDRDVFMNSIQSQFHLEKDQKIVIEWIQRALWGYQRDCRILNKLQGLFPDSEIFTTTHHMAHAASAYYPSGFDRSAILCIDGYGENETITLCEGTKAGIHILNSSSLPHSIGILYEIMTEFLGFHGFSDAYKVMGMAAYGEPRFTHLFNQLGQVEEDGTFRLNLGALLLPNEIEKPWSTRCLALSPKLQKILGGPRGEGEPITQTHYDIANSFQRFVEDIGVALAKSLRTQLPDCDSLCLAGGVALNGLMNQRIFKEAGFKNIFIQPAASDDGLSLGAALAVVAEKYGRPPVERVKNMFLGPERDKDESYQEIERLGLHYTCPNDPAATVAELLAQGHVIARYSGRSEFGPRALGNRSILASPLKAEMKDIINARIKHREPFRPFAPACLAEDVSSFFDADEDAEYMLLICQVREDKKHLLPAVVHADGTARVQSVKKDSNPGFYNIISAFKKITGIPVVINTSFNVNGEAIVETPLDAIECFLYTDIDYLLIHDRLIAKKDNEDKRIIEPAETFLSRRRDRFLSHYPREENFYPSLNSSLTLPASCLSENGLLRKWISSPDLNCSRKRSSV